MGGLFKYNENENVRVPKLNSLDDRLTTVETFPHYALPMVDSSIPPVFIQSPDGSLVWTEIS